VPFPFRKSSLSFEITKMLNFLFQKDWCDQNENLIIRSKVVAKKHFKTKMEFTGSGSRFGGLPTLEKCSFRY